MILSAFHSISCTKKRHSGVYSELRVVHLRSFYSTQFLQKQPMQPTESRKDFAPVVRINGEGIKTLFLCKTKCCKSKNKLGSISLCQELRLDVI